MILDVTGSNRWQRSKGRLPEEDKEFMKALVKQSIKMEINKKEEERTEKTSRLLMTWIQCLDL